MQVEGSLLCIYVTTSANLILYNQVLFVTFLLRRIRGRTVLRDVFVLWLSLSMKDLAL